MNVDGDPDDVTITCWSPIRPFFISGWDHTVTHTIDLLCPIICLFTTIEMKIVIFNLRKSYINNRDEKSHQLDHLLLLQRDYFVCMFMVVDKKCFTICL
jgi:hypothetical protein